MNSDTSAAPAKRRPPKKRVGQARGPRRVDGALLDVATLARELGDTEKGIRAKIARGLLPYRRWGSRIVFMKASIAEYLDRLPGVSVDEAIENVRARLEQ